MQIDRIPPGTNPPEEVNVMVEVPARAEPVKYEMDKDSGALFVDRMLGTSMHYPVNYGFIPNTLGGDGDPIDVMVVTDIPINAGSVIAARPIGVMMMTDDGGIDEKVLAVPAHHIDPSYDDVRSFEDLPKQLRDKIQHFFSHYKDLEDGKWAQISGWEDATKAKEVISTGISTHELKNDVLNKVKTGRSNTSEDVASPAARPSRAAI